MGRLIGIDLGGSRACVAILEAGRPKVVPGRPESPLPSPNLEEACCVVLRELKAAAEAYLGEGVQGAVVALPAHLGYAQGRTIAEASRRAGLAIGRALYRATAAALTYALDDARGQSVAVCALESDHCEVSILEIAEGMVQVRATVADISPPGVDLEPRIRELCRRCLDEAGMRAYAVDQVLVVGGRSGDSALDGTVLGVFGKEPNRLLNPEAAVAMGAAVRTGLITGEVKDLVLLDVTPHTLGVETKGGGCMPLIGRNSTVPTRKSRRFSTTADHQGRVEVHVLEGESDRAAGNRSLARLELTDLPPTPREIEVTIEIDVNPIVSVGLEDLATGRGHDLVLYSIGPDSGLLAEGASKTHGEASTLVPLPPRPEEAAPGSEPALTEAKAAHQIDGLSSNVMRMLQALESNITPNERERILAAVERGRRVRAGGDLEELKASLKELEGAATIIGQALLRP